MLSIGSAGSILSIGSAGSILSVRSRGKILCIDDQPIGPLDGKARSAVGLVAAASLIAAAVPTVARQLVR